MYWSKFSASSYLRLLLIGTVIPFWWNLNISSTNYLQTRCKEIDGNCNHCGLLSTVVWTCTVRSILLSTLLLSFSSMPASQHQFNEECCTVCTEDIFAIPTSYSHIHATAHELYLDLTLPTRKLFWAVSSATFLQRQSGDHDTWPKF